VLAFLIVALICLGFSGSRMNPGLTILGSREKEQRIKALEGQLRQVNQLSEKRSKEIKRFRDEAKAKEEQIKLVKAEAEKELMSIREEMEKANSDLQERNKACEEETASAIKAKHTSEEKKRSAVRAMKKEKELRQTAELALTEERRRIDKLEDHHLRIQKVKRQGEAAVKEVIKEKEILEEELRSTKEILNAREAELNVATDTMEQERIKLLSSLENTKADVEAAKLEAEVAAKSTAEAEFKLEAKKCELQEARSCISKLESKLSESRSDLERVRAKVAELQNQIDNMIEAEKQKEEIQLENEEQQHEGEEEEENAKETLQKIKEALESRNISLNFLLGRSKSEKPKGPPRRKKSKEAAGKPVSALEKKDQDSTPKLPQIGKKESLEKPKNLQVRVEQKAAMTPPATKQKDISQPIVKATEEEKKREEGVSVETEVPQQLVEPSRPKLESKRETRNDTQHERPRSNQDSPVNFEETPPSALKHEEKAPTVRRRTRSKAKIHPAQEEDNAKKAEKQIKLQAQRKAEREHLQQQYKQQKKLQEQQQHDRVRKARSKSVEKAKSEVCSMPGENSKPSKLEIGANLFDYAPQTSDDEMPRDGELGGDIDSLLFNPPQQLWQKSTPSDQQDQRTELV